MQALATGQHRSSAVAQAEQMLQQLSHTYIARVPLHCWKEGSGHFMECSHGVCMALNCAGQVSWVVTRKQKKYHLTTKPLCGEEALKSSGNPPRSLADLCAISVVCVATGKCSRVFDTVQHAGHAMTKTALQLYRVPELNVHTALIKPHQTTASQLTSPPKCIKHAATRHC